MENEKTNKPGEELAEQKEQLSASTRFTEQVFKEFGNSVNGALQVTDYQRSLIQGYFIVIDRALKAAEDERLRKNAGNKDHEKYDNTLPINWKTVNLTDLALDVVHYAKLGLDMMQENHLFPIPYKNNKAQRYDITLMPGYNGIRYVAEKYALTKPRSVTVEVVYSTDMFLPIKKSGKNQVESYEFEITDAFNRGEIVGGFAYIQYDDPTRNELIVMNMHDIQKRKPRYASANFWGGVQKEYQDGKLVEVEKEGWLDEMVRKTIIREAYSAKHIPRDPKKVDDDYQYMKDREARYAEIEAQAEIEATANTVMIDTTATSVTAPESPDTQPGTAGTAAPTVPAGASGPAF